MLLASSYRGKANAGKNSLGFNPAGRQSRFRRRRVATHRKLMTATQSNWRKLSPTIAQPFKAGLGGSQFPKVPSRDERNFLPFGTGTRFDNFLFPDCAGSRI